MPEGFERVSWASRWPVLLELGKEYRVIQVGENSRKVVKMILRTTPIFVSVGVCHLEGVFLVD